MEDLQNLSNEIDNIKGKIKDKEYKTIMELMGKIHKENKPKKRIKVLEIQAKVYVYWKDNNGNSDIDEISKSGFAHSKCYCNDECDGCNADVETLEISKPDYKTRHHTLTITDDNINRPIDFDTGLIRQHIYEIIKKEGFIGMGNVIAVYVNDIN